jgi:HK97 gp10 family phage protein
MATRNDKMVVGAQVVGISELRAKLERMGVDASKDSVKGLQLGAEVVVGSAKLHIRTNPHTLASGEQKAGLVDTGNLMNSVQAFKPYYQQGGRGGSRAVAVVEVGTNVEYGIYHEYGTSRMDKHPWLRPAFDESQAKVRKVMTAYLTQRVEEEGRRKASGAGLGGGGE